MLDELYPVFIPFQLISPFALFSLLLLSLSVLIGQTTKILMNNAIILALSLPHKLQRKYTKHKLQMHLLLFLY